jgi:hypothetical protein
MSAHTITTQAWVGARGRKTRTIFALSLAVVLLGATASTVSAERDPTATLTGTAVTTPTPPAPPLTLDKHGRKQELEKRVKFRARTSNDSTLVATGAVKKTTKQAAAGEVTRFKARLKHLKRLKERSGKPEVKIKLAATDEFGQTATAEVKVTLCSRLIPDPAGVTRRCAPLRSSR